MGRNAPYPFGRRDQAREPSDKRLEGNAHDPHEENGEDDAHEDAEDHCEYSRPVHLSFGTRGRGGRPMPQLVRRECRCPPVLPTKPGPVRCVYPATSGPVNASRLAV
jgi:hypothetical protein